MSVAVKATDPQSGWWNTPFQTPVRLSAALPGFSFIATRTPRHGGILAGNRRGRQSFAPRLARKPIHRLPRTCLRAWTQSQFRPILPVSSIWDEAVFLGTSVADGGFYFSRFTVKFTEILAVGMATAVSGYLIAHVSGFLSSPAPSPILPAPNAGQVTVNHPAPPSAGAVNVNNPAAPSLPVQSASPGQPAPPAPLVSTDANESHAAPSQEIATPAKPPARPTVSAAPARKRGAHDTGTAESKPSESAQKPRGAAQ